MKDETARVLGLRALGWLAADDALFAAFLTATGADVASVRAAADQPEILAATLDFILQSDEWVLACAQAAGVGPQDMVTARAVLGGRDTMHWT